MKKIRIFATALLLAFTLSSCESFFDVELDDQAKIEDIFRQKTEVQKYLSHLYSYIPQEEEVVGMHGWTVGRSDEALFSWYQWVYYTQFRTGNYSSATTNFNYWPDYYIGINQCSIFLKYIDLDKEDTPTTVAYMKAEARFLRAYYYFLLFRQYGPVFIWGDQIADETIDAKSVDRHTVQENIDFMVGELDAAGTYRRHRYRRQTVGRPCYARCSLGAEIAHTALRSIAVIQRVRPLQRPDAEHSRGIPLPAEQGRDQMGGSRTGSLGCDRVGRDRFVRSLQGYGTDR